MRTRPLLGSHLDDPLAPASDIDHPSSFTHKQTQWFLDVDILTGCTGHHGHQGVPVVGGRDDDRIDVAIVEQGPEVAILSGTPADQGCPFIETSAMDLGKRDQAGIRLLLEIQDVPLADQPEPDEAETNPIVRTDDLLIARRGQGRCGTRLEKSPPVRPGVICRSSRSSSLEIVGSLERSRSGPGDLWSRPSFWPARRPGASHR